MAHISADRVADTTSSTGTTALTLDNLPPNGSRAFSAVMSNGDTCYYSLQHVTANEWETGQGTFTGGTLSRDVIFASSAGGSAVSLSAGKKDIYIVLPASKTPLAPVPVNQGGTGATTASDARTSLGLGTLATQNGVFSGVSSGLNTGDQDLSGLVPNTTTINSKALTGNVTLTTADIADSTNKRYVSDAALTVLGSTSGTNSGDQQVFKTIAVAGQPDVVADAPSDTLTLVAGSNITLMTNASTDTVTITSTAAGMTSTQKSQLKLSLLGG